MSITGESSGFMQPEVVLPAQFGQRRSGAQSGEYRLVVAVLDDAIQCYRNYACATDRQGQQLFREAEAWLMGREQTPFSFLYVCDVLGLESRAIRQRLLRWRAQQADTVLPETA